MSSLDPLRPSRRQFLKRTSQAAIGSLAVAPFVLASTKKAEANTDTLRVGLVGCGGRGTGAASQALAADKNVHLTALGDVFEDRLQHCLKSLSQDGKTQARVTVKPDHCFTGFDAYQKVIASGVDVVLLAAPPGFRPLHLEAAVAARKHIFCEKPMAVDAPGARRVLAAAREAKRNNLSLVSGFCWRYNSGERAFFRQIHDGAIGDIVALQTNYLTGPIWSFPRKPEWTDMQWQMRNWYYFTWLSGDHIVEQAIHSIDKMSWAMKDADPAAISATGGRQVRTDPLYGHIYDHFAVTYEYPEGPRAFHFCRQMENCLNDNSDYFMGTKGVGRIVAFGGLDIRGEKNWRYGSKDPRPNMYQVEHDELFASIRAGNPMNDGEWMTRSTMLGIAGRMAAYTGQRLTWDDVLNSKEVLGPKTFSWDQPLPVPPVAIPGKTKFV